VGARHLSPREAARAASPASDGAAGSRGVVGASGAAGGGGARSDGRAGNRSNGGNAGNGGKAGNGGNAGNASGEGAVGGAGAGVAGSALPPPPAKTFAERLGWAVLAALFVALLIGALNFDRTGRPSLVGDEATYAMQAASLAWDLDLAYSRGDYDRFVAQWGGPPDGVILQSRDGGAHITYGKPFLYAMAVAPFVRLSPLRGAQVANVLMLAAAALLAARTLRRVAGPLAPFAVAVLVFGSVAFAYVFWVHADVFLLAAAAAGLALAYQPDPPIPEPGTALYQESTYDSGHPARRWWWRWLLAGLLLAIPGAYRPFYLALLVPAALAAPRGRRLRAGGALACGAVALLLATAAVQRAAGGDWNGYGGQRLGFYAQTGYPAVDFPAADWDAKLRQWGNTSWVQEGAFDPSPSVRLWGWNVLYFLVGRDVGVVPYFMPLVLGLLAYRAGRGRWALAAAVLAAAFCFLLIRPFNFYGGGGAIGNRYFLPLYPALWFLAGRPLKAAHLALAAALAAPFLWPLWRRPAAFPVGEDGRYAYVSAVARTLLPYETTQSHIPGGQDASARGIWVKLLNHDAWRAAGGHGLRMVASGEADLLVGSPTPLPYLAVELDRRAPSRLDAGGLVLHPSLLRPDGWEVFEVALRSPRAVHPMWWTRDDVYLYEVKLRLPGGRAEPVGLDLGRGEDPAKVEAEPDLTPLAGGTP
jgi:hypothetical protein